MLSTQYLVTREINIIVSCFILTRSHQGNCYSFRGSIHYFNPSLLVNSCPQSFLVVSSFQSPNAIKHINYFDKVRMDTYSGILLTLWVLGRGREGCYILSPLELTSSSVLPVLSPISFFCFVVFSGFRPDPLWSSQAAIIQDLQFSCNKFGSSPIFFSTSCTKL